MFRHILILFICFLFIPASHALNYEEAIKNFESIGNKEPCVFSTNNELPRDLSDYDKDRYKSLIGVRPEDKSVKYNVSAIFDFNKVTGMEYVEDGGIVKVIYYRFTFSSDKAVKSRYRTKNMDLDTPKSKWSPWSKDHYVDEAILLVGVEFSDIFPDAKQINSRLEKLKASFKAIYNHCRK